MNEFSSRSHAIFTVVVECATARASAAGTSVVGGTTAADQQHIRVGKLNLVDLAGSERQEQVLHSSQLSILSE